MKQERSGSKLGGLGEGCEEPELQTEELGPDSLGCGKQWKIQQELFVYGDWYLDFYSFRKGTCLEYYFLSMTLGLEFSKTGEEK